MLSMKAKSAETSPIDSRAGDESILWAIDPLAPDHRRLVRALAAIDSWREGVRARVLPVSVLAPLDFNWPVEIVAPLREKLDSVIDRRLKPALRKLRASRSESPRLLVANTASRRQAVKALLEFAAREKPDFLFVDTRTKKGQQRLGSWAQLLIALSPVPVIALNPHAKIPPRVKTILFATDFSPASRRAFDRVLRWARHRRAAVVLYHRFENPYLAVASGEPMMGIAPTVIEGAGREAERNCRSRADGWQRRASRAGVRCDAIIDRGDGASFGSTGDRILRASVKAKADMIALTTYRGPIAQAFLGSVAWDVLTSASRPVLVLHERG